LFEKLFNLFSQFNGIHLKIKQRLITMFIES